MDGSGTLSLLVLVWIGIAVLWSLRLAYRNRGARADDPVRLVLTIAGWLLILAGILGTAFQTFVIFAPLAWGIILDTVLLSVANYRQAERRTLLRCLAAAAARGIPLEQAARAFSLERSDELGLRAARLAELLESGMPLSLCLAETRTRLPIDVDLAVRIGVDTGDFASAIASIPKSDDDAEWQLRAMLERFFYLSFVGCVLMGILTFVMLKIVPVFAKMFEEFDLELPDITQACIAVSEFSVQYWPCVMLPLYVLVFGPFLRRMVAYFGGSADHLSIFSGWLRRRDTALLLRALAFSVRQQRPISSMVGLLAHHYPRRGIRKRLRRAGQAIERGEHWCHAFQRARLIRRADSAVLIAAERSGNLEWALEEMADSNLRGLTYRFRMIGNVLFPIVLFVFGIAIAFFVIGLFVPLVELIQGMT